MSENQTGSEAEHQSHSARHMLMMLLCCLLPIAVVFGFSFAFPANPYLNFLVIAICPLSMILMHLPNLISKKKKEKNSCH